MDELGPVGQDERGTVAIGVTFMIAWSRDRSIIRATVPPRLLPILLP
jgi:hypothetical protein